MVSVNKPSDENGTLLPNTVLSLITPLGLLTEALRSLCRGEGTHTATTLYVIVSFKCKSKYFLFRKGKNINVLHNERYRYRIINTLDKTQHF